MATCQSCKTVVEDKLKAAIMNNICPYCGDSIYNKIEFVYRKKITEILHHYGVTDADKVNSIVNDLCELTNGEVKSPMPATFKPEGDPLNGVASSDINEITEADINAPHTETEEETVVREMIEAGEIAVVRPVAEKRIPLGKTKKIPVPINRLS